ncbi:hypothetical protein GCM10029976_094290 [Kribbella albertanoniae]|nr:fibronectin type III domain-containing protein [Kribbella albertanoniae]
MLIRPRSLIAVLASLLCFAFATSATAVAAGDTQPPSTPANLRVTSSSANTLSLAWDAAHDNFGGVGYHVSLDTPHHSDDTGSRTTHVFQDLRPGTTYLATLSTFDARGNRAPDVRLNVTTASVPGPSPTAPANLRPVFVNGVLHSLEWTPSVHTQAVVYKVYSSNLGLFTLTGATSLRIWDLVNLDCVLEPGSTHAITIAAIDSAGRVSDLSNSLAITVPNAPIR